MSDDTRVDEILEVLEAAGLTEVHLNDDGQEAVRLTVEGAALAEELRILEHGPGPDAPTMAGDSGEPPPETVAGEHVPERGLAGEGEGTMVTFPDEVAREHR